MANEGELFEANFSTEEVIALAKVDPDFLSALAIPEIFVYQWPPVFRAVWTWLLQTLDVERSFPKLALGLPRGFGKTTLVKLLCLYVILFTDRKFILICSATAAHAVNIISDIMDMLDEPNIKKLFGSWRIAVEKDTQDIKKFSFRGRDIIIAGIGAGGSVRGLNLKNERPDVMIFEDVQKREDADSQTVSDKLYSWMLGTAMKAKSPKGCLTLFIANMYPTPHSILRKLKSNKQWTKFIAGGILANGESLWEELQPINQLLDEFQADLESGHPEIFYAEVLNDENASVNMFCDISKIPPYTLPDDDIPVGKFIIIDPSGDKVTSDDVSIGYFEVHDGYAHLKEVIAETLSPGETIRKALSLALKHQCFFIAIESNAYQASLLYWFNFIMQQMQLTGIQCGEVYSGRNSKNSRILDMFKQLLKSELFYHPRTAVQVNLQISSFNALKKDNVDGILDLLTYAPKVLGLYGEYIQVKNIFEDQEWSSASNVIPDVLSTACF